MDEQPQQVAQPAEQPAPPAQAVDYAKYVAHYIALRAKKKAMTEEFAEKLKPITDVMAMIEALVGNHLSSTNAESIKTAGGTAYESITYSASIADPIEFQGYVIANRAWDMIDWKANVTAAQDFLKEHKTNVPGVTITPFRKVNFRKPTKKDAE